jgi:uncharacterized protein YcsI (UPF0317 family)
MARASETMIGRMALTPVHEARMRIRAGRYSGQTAGLAPGYLQGNLAILPGDLALDFARYCQRNPKPCPLVGVSDSGNPMLTTLGADIDIRTDVPRYNVYRDGELADQPSDVIDLWRGDFVAFILGCSFSFEQALLDNGVPLRHIETGATVAMYITNIATAPAGPFEGPMVVSMRPLRPADAIRAVEVTSRFPAAHGVPIHLGDPGEIGIGDLNRPDWGDVPDIRDGEMPVFWACGVTPQVAIRAARPSVCITHKPGSMLITDLPSTQASDQSDLAAAAMPIAATN